MEIIIRNNNRILIKENSKEININDGDIIQYNGIYYKNINDIVRTVNIETTFIGIVENCMSRYDTGVIGIYVKPLYIYDIVNSEWLKIVNLNPPTTKYFLYPHLLMLPQNNYYSGSGHHPLFFLDTCENKSLDEFVDIQKPFILC
uniref:Uncharacterized protein n=1 Tax=viral metagenome TaxID=1070528 RepID=A0A6C0ER84_9ZZZZ